MLRSINLSLSSLCGADCIFCPTDTRGTRMREKNMSFDIIEKIVNEISSDNFKQNHSIKKIEMGENGDAFFNKNFIRILRSIRTSLPEVFIHFNTNFQLMTPENTEIIIGENLLNRVSCFVDGSTEFNYYNVKRINLEKVTNNIKNFIEKRDNSNSNIGVYLYVMSLNSYIHKCYSTFGFYPTKMKDKNLIKIPDDSKLVIDRFKKYLHTKKDNIRTYEPYFWAERDRAEVEIEKNNINYEGQFCPVLDMVYTGAFIAPDGSWYACCNDSNYDQVFGNVNNETLDEIFNGKTRKDFLNKLELKKFKELGGPCATVMCCHQAVV